MKRYLTLSLLSMLLLPSANAGIIRTAFKGSKAVVRVAAKGTGKVVKVAAKVIY